MTRRTLLAAAAAAAPRALTAASAARVVGANDRLRIGVIGVGGMATGHIRGLLRTQAEDNTEIVAVCDVYQKRLDRAVETTKAKPFTNYHELLDQKDIDYVLIATPEHWHYKMVLDTLAAGKHVYCEKPLTHTVDDCARLVKKVKASKLLVQVGVQGMSDESYAEANKLIQDGVIGKVVAAQIDYSRNHKDDFWVYQQDPDCQPGVNLDWKAWLGPAPKRAYDPDRFFSWRRYWDYSSGIASDLFIHRVTRLIRAIGLGFPVRAVATGGKYQFTNSAAEIPDTMNILLEYEGGPDVMLVSSMANETQIPHLVRGHKGTIEFTRTGFTLTPQRQYQNEVKPVEYTKTGSESTELHHRNLHNAIRNGEALKCDVDLAYKGVVACAMGTEAMRRRKSISWDSSRERMVKS